MSRRLASVALGAAVTAMVAACGGVDGATFGDGERGSGSNNGRADPEGTFGDPFGPGGEVRSVRRCDGHRLARPRKVSFGSPSVAPPRAS